MAKPHWITVAEASRLAEEAGLPVTHRLTIRSAGEEGNFGFVRNPGWTRVERNSFQRWLDEGAPRKSKPRFTTPAVESSKPVHRFASRRTKPPRYVKG